MTFAVVVFPGSNCDHDAYYAVKHVLGQEARFVWHKETTLGDADVVILPGGFSHGDYLRTGAIARFSPIMAPVRAFAAAGRPGARRLQRVPDPAGVRPAARRDAAEPRPEVPLRIVGVRVERDRHAVHRPVRARPGAAAADRARRRQLLRAARGHRRARGGRAASCSATRRRTARSRTRPIRTDRSTTSPASAARRATSSA